MQVNEIGDCTSDIRGMEDGQIGKTSSNFSKKFHFILPFLQKASRKKGYGEANYVKLVQSEQRKTEREQRERRSGESAAVTCSTWFEERVDGSAAASARHLRMDAVPGEQRRDLVDLRMTDAQCDQQLVVHPTQVLQRNTHKRHTCTRRRYEQLPTAVHPLSVDYRQPSKSFD